MSEPTSIEPAEPAPLAGQPPAARVIAAVYEGGVIRPAEPLDLPADTPLRLTIGPPGPDGALSVALAPAPAAPPDAAPAAEPLADAPPAPQSPATATAAAHPPAAPAVRLARADWLVLGASLVFYLATRLIGLAAFPIYFFCDEAIQTVLARNLLANGLRGPDGVFLPPYFLNAEKWNLSLSIYIHAIGAALVPDNSVLLTRGVSALVSLLAVAAVGLTLRLIFQSRFWWAGMLALAAAPTWVLHARTAFETVMMVAFYACFLCCYLLYRYRDTVWLYPALVFGGMTFYSYANGQGVMLVSGLLLLLSDWRYHLGPGRRRLLPAAAILLLLLVPLLRFRMLQPEAYAEQLRHLDSYWLRTLPLSEKLAIFARNYLTGLSPAYWFFPNEVDLARHRMAGMGHMALITLPFVGLGLFECLRRWRSPAHRAVLAAILAAPFSMALVGPAITRVLALLVPAALLTAIGLDLAYGWLRARLPYLVAAAGVALALAGSTALTLRGALADGPTWFTDYGLSGMQYGAQQLFGEAIPAALAADPDDRLLISPTWANNPNVFEEFFLSPAQRARVEFLNVDAFTVSRQPLDPATQLFVMPDYEYERAIGSGKFVLDPPEQIIPYPDGRPGFYFVRMRYVDNVDELFAADRLARQELVAGEVLIDGAPAAVSHSLLDIGQIADLVDGDPNTLMRGFEANPLVVELRFPEPRELSQVALTVGTMNLGLRLSAEPADGGAAVTAEQEFRDQPPDPTVTLGLPGGPLRVAALRLEIRNLDAGDVAHIHVRELELR